MGSGFSSVEAELERPVDASDIYEGGTDAVEEVKRLRGLIASTTSQPATPLETVSFSSSLFLAAARKGDAAGVRVQVDAAGGNAEKLSVTNDDLESAVHLAASGGHDSVMEILVGSGIELNSKDDYGYSALRHIAGVSRKQLTSGHISCARILIESKASAMVTCDYGWTPLHKAAEMGHEELVKILLELSDVNATATENGGETAMDKAEDKGHTSIVEMVKAAAAASA